MVKRNLPPASELWGRDMDERVRKLELAASNLSTLITSNNNRVDTILASQKGIVQAQAELQIAQDELEATQTALSLAQSGLAAAQTNIENQVTFLSHQTVSAEAVPEGLTTRGPYSSEHGYTWVAYNETADATITLTVPSSGKLAVQAGGYLSAYSSNYATVGAFIGVEILNADGSVYSEPYPGDGNIMEVWGANTNISQAGSGHLHVWEGFPPGEALTFRCRRGFFVLAGSSGYSGTIYFQGTSLSISKVGM